MTPLTDQQLDPDRERKIRRNYADTDPNGTVRTLLDEIDRQRAALTEMTHCRDNAVRALQRDDVDTDPHLPNLFADGLHGLYEWEDQPQPDEAPQALVDRCVQIVQPAFGKLTQQLAAARAELAAKQAQHAFVLRQRNNRSERLNYLRDVAKSGQTGLLAEEALNTLASSINDHVPADPDEMAASLKRDGFGNDEIADMLGPGVTEGEAPEPVHLRWGLNDVQYGDDDSVIVMLSGPDREPYWLELDAERAAVLRANLAGPDRDDAEEIESGTRPCGHDDYHNPHEWADRPGIWCPGIGYDTAPAAVPAAETGE